MTSTGFLLASHADLIRGLAVLCERPDAGQGAIASSLGISPPSAADYTELFVQQMPPYASIYLDSEGKIGGEARDRIAGFWRALGMVPPPEPDHLASLLGLLAKLLDVAEVEPDSERRELIAHSARALAWEHLAPWLTPYLARLKELADDGFRTWAESLTRLVDADFLNANGFSLPQHLIEPAPGLAGSDDLVAFTLAPIRSGIVLLRHDLLRASTETRLGLRIGERAFSLQSLLDQDSSSVLGWLTKEARRQSELYLISDGDRRIREVWATRASVSANEFGRIVTS